MCDSLIVISSKLYLEFMEFLGARYLFVLHTWPHVYRHMSMKTLPIPTNGLGQIITFGLIFHHIHINRKIFHHHDLFASVENVAFILD